MSSEVRGNRWSQLVAWIVGSLFILGFFLSSVGAWTGPMLGAWFVGTQRVRRGFLWMLAFAFIPGLLMDWRKSPLTDAKLIPGYLASMLLVAVLSVLPFTFHRLTSTRMNGLVSTLPLPLAVVVMQTLVRPMVHAGAVAGSGIATFLIFWFAAVVVWIWNNEFRARTVAVGAGIFAAIFIVAEGFPIFTRSGLMVSNAMSAFSWVCLGGVILVSLWAVFHPEKRPRWAERPETVALLRSPFTGQALHVISEQRRETLVSDAGERFPVRDGIPAFLRPEDLTGDNGKYNHLYQTIGGFYDDTQRFFGAFRGLALDSYFRNYMDLLDVKPGDSVLETSVGTGLNFKYLPRGVKLSGLDLSQEMLINCQRNLSRWGMEADLCLGNAERLPFADASFDVVYTAGAFNFFTDRQKAIREMIRVAKPGAPLMIEDETEEYVKSTYENIPFTSSFYKDRKDAVTVPIDLVPEEMEDIRLEMLKDGKFYAIRFRKPLAAAAKEVAGDDGFVLASQCGELAPASRG